ncbi:interleukin-20 receptor subunit alpha-like [Eublepharis macularius]|uniref:Interleukin-20 receptor subunit alpha-like n=1 Tax=Eublepharis macularius TaxID=481883 RepID=A0AA97LDX7_EUBMA|nr:interleukin-20 receptor subunit alpha-like [Eublepharis macularius]
MVIFLILGNAFCYESLGSSVQGALLRPPQNVTLTSINCDTFLTWHPSPDLTNSTEYEVEIISSRNVPKWTKVTSCQGNKTRERSKLLLPDPFDHYRARVRVRDGARLSEWAFTEVLQPYSDTVIGPLNLSLAATYDSLTAVFVLPHIPTDNNVSKFFKMLTYERTLTKEDHSMHLIAKAENQFWLFFTSLHQELLQKKPGGIFFDSADSETVASTGKGCLTCN